MAAPQTRGLIAHAIGESGGALYSAGLSYPARETLEQRNVDFAQTAFGTSKLADLRNKLAGNDKLEDILSEVLSNTEKLDSLRKPGKEE